MDVPTQSQMWEQERDDALNSVAAAENYPNNAPEELPDVPVLSSCPD